MKKREKFLSIQKILIFSLFINALIKNYTPLKVVEPLFQDRDSVSLKKNKKLF